MTTKAAEITQHAKSEENSVDPGSLLFSISSKSKVRKGIMLKLAGNYKWIKSLFILMNYPIHIDNYQKCFCFFI